MRFLKGLDLVGEVSWGLGDAEGAGLESGYDRGQDLFLAFVGVLWG